MELATCLPFTGVETFGQRLLQSAANRIIIDTVIDGDGAFGRRTAHSRLPSFEPDWDKTTHAHQLHDYLKEKTVRTDL